MIMINKIKHGKIVSKQFKILYSLTILITTIGLLANTVSAQETNSYPVGNPLGMTSDGDFQPISSNINVYGALHTAESCIYDAERDLIVVPSMGTRQNVQENN